MERVRLIEEINKVIIRENLEEITWGQLCKYTDFDSFITALSYGMNWGKEVAKMEDARLKMILFNITEFPFGSRVSSKIKKENK